MTIGRKLEVGLLRLMKRVQHKAAQTAVAGREPPQDPKIVIARVIGNDLWPRHALGQSLKNLEFVLSNEPTFAGTKKLFVLTRIVDEKIQAQAEAMVRDAGHDVIILPFDPVAYSSLRVDTSAFGGDSHFMTDDFLGKSESKQGEDRLWAAASKIRHVMDVNGGRNAALAWGQSRADWTMVLDGSCFLGAEAFQTLRKDLTSQPFMPYVVLPMCRLTQNEAAFSTPPAPNEIEEPQLAFSSLAKGRFAEAYPYGLRDKTSLLGQIGVPGHWENWSLLRHLPALPALPDSHCWKRASAAVFRLTSGLAEGQLEQAGASRKRYQSRNRAIFLTLAALDARLDNADRDRARKILGVEDVTF